MKLKAIPVFLAFLAMGFGDAVGPFVSLAKNQFQLTTAVATLIPFVGLGMFGLISIPAGVLQNRLGRKSVLLLGLVVALAGMMNASFGLTSFVRFLLTVLLIGAGAAILQVAGNPLMRDVSAPGKFPRNLALGQFVKALGSLSGPMIPMIAARYFGVGWNVIFPIYGAALILTIMTASMLNVPRDVSPPQAATMRSCLSLLGDRYVLLMTGAIFLYVGAEVLSERGVPALSEGTVQPGYCQGRSARHWPVLHRTDHRTIQRRTHPELGGALEVSQAQLRACTRWLGYPVCSFKEPRRSRFPADRFGLCQYLSACVFNRARTHAGKGQ